ncbi:MAG: MBOAT family protein [Pedosphaera sp.]|nr:MBOAT family protein [Pedosphaera sp.]
MLFNSTVFIQFFAAFLLLYWLVRNHLAARNILVVTASYLFYGWWDWRFLTLLAFSSVVDFLLGLAIERAGAPGRRKSLLCLSVTANLGLLGFFKYYDFFVNSLAESLQSLNLPINLRTLGIILPVGISFYTFQSLSYTIDVYRREIPATRKLIDFLAFVSFFPQLVAGPIERARHLLPQFERTLPISRDMMEHGISLILLGLFKKVVLADNLAPLVDLVYGNDPGSGPLVVLGTVAFALQIYGDFSGYSDIARGTAWMLGFDLMLNFNAPYSATSIQAFWRRWHISLSTWLRDYLYVSLGGNRRGAARTGANLMLTMVLGGLWHGAAWHYVLWGAWHGIALVIERALGLGASRTSLTGRLFGWVATMLVVLYGWLLFRAHSIEQITAMTRSLGNFSVPLWFGSFAINLLMFGGPLLLLEVWRARNPDPASTPPIRCSTVPKRLIQGAMLIAILLYWEQEKTPFIYFQF